MHGPLPATSTVFPKGLSGSLAILGARTFVVWLCTDGGIRHAVPGGTFAFSGKLFSSENSPLRGPQAR